MAIRQTFSGVRDDDPSVEVEVFRPVQFLGSKLRLLSQILDAANEVSAEHSSALDLFSGSSVVSQALSGSGRNVTAVDALGHCTTFARAMLQVDREGHDASWSEIARRVESYSVSGAATVAFEDWCVREREAVRDGDGFALMELTKAIPQIWRPDDASTKQLVLFRHLSDQVGQTAFEPSGLVASHYAGGYFGIVQAIDIDDLRAGIEASLAADAISQWDADACVTALLSAASECVFSAGKHYAQSHNINGDKDLRFAATRIVTDRRKQVRDLFRSKLREVFRVAASNGAGNSAFNQTFESHTSESTLADRVGLIYADPPYTAQQYSRFYHVPEVIDTYRVPSLQIVNDRFTKGLYPVDRHRSDFCSRRNSPKAFKTLFEFARDRSEALLLSYSATSSDSGNARSIGLDELLALASQILPGAVNVRGIDHEYRKFNSGALSVRPRLDEEVLISWSAKC